MTQENGGINSTDLNKAGNNANGNNQEPNGGRQDDKTDIQKQFDDLNAKFETLLKESKGKDSKISSLLKEKETQLLASKTAEEQLDYYRNQTALLERKEAFRQSFKEVGLNPDEFMGIVDEKDPAIQAGKFAALLKAQKELSAKQALEQFKADELKKLGQPPQTNGNTTHKSANFDKNNLLRGIAD